MATRTISTKLAIEGESEYRSSLARINTEIKTLQSALKLTESQYQTNANSMSALSAKGDALNNLYKAQKSKVDELKAALENAKKAEEEYAAQKAALTAKIEENNKKLEDLKQTTGDTSAEQKKLVDENKGLAEQLERCDANLVASEKGVNSWQTQLNNAQIKLNDLDAELKLNGEYLTEAEKSSDKCATSIDRFGERTKESADKASELKDALAAAGVIAALKATADALDACVDSSVSFETSMASVKRTVGGTEEFIGGMSESFKDLSSEIPITTSELASIATTAGQLGIQQDKVEQFTTVMAKLSTTTDLTADNAATMLAQFSNITGVTDFDRLGSVVADLGDATATTASKVVDMSQGMAAAANIAGLTAQDILAISASVGSLGIEAAAGSTAMSTLISTLYKAVETGDGLADFASVANMSAQEFRVAWGTDAAGALNSFIQGLNDTERNGKSAIVILDDLGIKNVRQTKAILGLASAGDLLSNTLKQGNAAWESNTALGEKAAVMYGTTEAKLQMLSSSFDNCKIAVGDKLTPALGNLADTGTTVLSWLSDTVEQSDALVPVVTSLVVALGTFAATVTTVATVTKLASAAMSLFAGTLATNPIFLTVTAVAALAAGIAALSLTISDGVPSVKELTTATRGLGDAFDESNSVYKETETNILATSSMAEKYIARLKELESQGLNTADSQNEYKQVVDKLNYIMPDLNAEIDEQNHLLIGGAEALEEQVSSWKKLALQEALTTKYNEQIKAWAEAELEVYENQVKLNAAQAEGSVMTERISELQHRMSEIYKEQCSVMDDSTKSAEEQNIAYWDLEKEYQKTVESLEGLYKQQKTNSAEQENLSTAISQGQGVVDEYEAAVNDAQAALDSFSASEKDASIASGEMTEATAEEAAAISGIKEELTDLAKNYADTYESAQKSIDGQIGLFDEFSATVSEDTDTVEEMMGRWAAQTKTLAEYTENLKKAAEYGLDKGLISSLSDGSAESAGHLATIIEKIEDLGGSTEGLSGKAADFVDKFNESFHGTEKAKESFAATVARMQTDLDSAISNMEKRAEEVNFSGFSKAVESAFSDVGVTFSNIGINIGAGMTKGVKQASKDASSATAGMAKAMTDAAKNELGVRSPSTKFEEIGKNTDLGAKQGVEKYSSYPVAAVKKMGADMEKEMSSAAKKAVESFNKEYAKITDKTKSQIDSLKSSVKKSASGLPDAMYGVGQDTINGMIRGMNNRSGQLYRTITGIVNTSIAKAKSAAAVRSPSKKTTEIFENVGEGMVVGLENKRKRVAETAQSVVNDALKLDISGKINVPTVNDNIPIVRNAYDDRRSDMSDFANRIEKSFDRLAKKVDDIAEGGFVFDGETVIGKWMPKIDSGLGTYKSQGDRGSR